MTTYLAQANTGADALASTRSVTKPAGVTAGAVGVFWLIRWHESGSFPAVTPPAGAVLRGTITTATMQTQCYLHRVGAETSYAYAWTSGRWSALAALWFSGIDPALDLAAVPFQSATGSGTAISTLTVTAAADSALAWHVNTVDTSGVSHNPPTGYTETADVSPWSAAYRITTSSGSQDASGATVSPTTAWAAGLVALPPASTGGATGDAALTGTAALSAAGQRTTTGSTALAATANLSAGGTRGAAGDAGLAATADVTASGQATAVGDGALAALAALTAGGQRDAATSAAFTTTTTLTAGGITTASASAGLAATAALTASGTTLTSGVDDVEVTVGAPYSPWAAGPPQTLAAWTVRAPHASSWEVGAPC